MIRSLSSLLLALSLAGCATSARKSSDSTHTAPPVSPAPSATVADRGETARPAPEDPLDSLTAAPIYFSLDSAMLPPEAGDELERLARALRQRSSARVTVSGHSCELGTTEYNVALGQRRADIVRGYLVRLGVEPQRIRVISYGEERPADPERAEKNRRAELSIDLGAQPQSAEL